ncbi:MAG: phosphoribosyltransferase [Nitrospira sp.]|nr:phosphoribosyltransferase [Nitrospira sp.]
MIFRNREEAGRRLAGKLQQYRDEPDGLVLALPRGGVPVGYQLSLELHLPLDVFVTRKIGLPENPEYALGAISETGNVYLNPDAVGEFRLSYQEVEGLVQIQREEIRRRQGLYRRGRHSALLKDRCVILVDDGVATGATFFASVAAIRNESPRLLVAAIPVGPMETIEKAKPLVDDLVVLAMPEPFWSVGEHYIEFAQVSDDEVVKYLNSADASHRDRMKGRRLHG